MDSPFFWGLGPVAALGLGAFAFLAVVAAIWSIFWKGFALWHAVRNGQVAWFVVLLIVNTIGILEIVYLLWFRKDKDTRPFSSLFSSGTPKAPESSVS